MTEIRKISRGFQITLPRAFRELHELKIGDAVETSIQDNQLIIKPVIQALNKENVARKLLDLLNNDLESEQSTLSDEELLQRLRQNITEKQL